MAAVANIVGKAYAAHNTFISVLVELGVIGELLLLALLAIALDCTVRMRNQERLLWSVLLVTWSVGVSGATWEYRKVTWFLFSLLAAHAYARCTEKPSAGYSADRLQAVQETALDATQTSRLVRYS
jgi:O-antigen ligase